MIIRKPGKGWNTIIRNMSDIKRYNKKIAIIYGGEICQGGLGFISKELADAFKETGCETELAYLEDPDSIVDFFGNTSYDAIIGIQNSWLTRKLSFGYISELSDVPKFNILLDSPSWARFMLKENAPNIIYLYHDEQYTDFIRKYYPHNRVYHIPLGGSMGHIASKYLVNNPDRLFSEKEYDISFIGTYYDYRKLLEENTQNDETKAYLINNYFEEMRSNPDINAQDSYFNMLEKLKLDLPAEEALDVLAVIFPADRAVFSYYRENTVAAMLDNGLKIDVF